MKQSPHSSPQSRPRVITAIPAYNVEQFIGKIVAQAKKYVDEVIVVDDGSTDNTAQAAEMAGAQVVRHQINLGAGGATKSCFEIARNKDTDILVTLDGDGQHNPEEIPQLLVPMLSSKVDLVIGSRFLDKQSNIPRYRRFGIGVITLLYNFGAKIKVSDAQSCFRAYSRKAIDTLNITERGFGFSVQLLIQARHKGLVITEVPISCVYHANSHNLNPIIHGVAVALAIVKFRLQSRLSSLSKGESR